MRLVAALAVSFRWPGSSVPVVLLFLHALAQRRDILRRPTRVALGQIALALYLPPAVGLFCVPFEAWDEYLRFVSLMPIFAPASLIMGIDWVVGASFFSPGGEVGMVVLSVSPLAILGALGAVGRRGIAWQISCLIVASGMSALSMFVILVVAGAIGACGDTSR